MQLNRVVLPSRFHTKTATKLLASEAEIKKINDTAWQAVSYTHLTLPTKA